MGTSFQDRFPMRLWEFRADMNFDGAVTISDVWLWIKWLCFYPGDYLLASVIGSQFGNFFEFTPAVFGGGLSFVFSAFAWLFAMIVALSVTAWTIESARSVARFITSPAYRGRVRARDLAAHGENEARYHAWEAERNARKEQEDAGKPWWNRHARWPVVFVAYAIIIALIAYLVERR